MALFTNSDWSKTTDVRSASGMSTSFSSLVPNAIHDFDRVRIAALLQDRQVDGALPVHADDVVLQRLRVLRFADVRHSHRRLPHHLQRHLIDVGHAAEHAVGVDVVVEAPDLHVAGRQNHVRFADRPHHVHQAQLVRFQLERIGVQHHLAAASAERLRHRRARNAGQLIANHVLRDVLELRLGKAFASERQQADRQAGRVELENHRRQRARRQAAHFGSRKSADHGDRGIGIRARMEVNLDDADAGQRSGLDVLNAASERQKALQPDR